MNERVNKLQYQFQLRQLQQQKQNIKKEYQKKCQKLQQTLKKENMQLFSLQKIDQLLHQIEQIENHHKQQIQKLHQQKQQLEQKYQQYKQHHVQPQQLQSPHFYPWEEEEGDGDEKEKKKKKRKHEENREEKRRKQENQNQKHIQKNEELQQQQFLKPTGLSTSRESSSSSCNDLKPKVPLNVDLLLCFQDWKAIYHERVPTPFHPQLSPSQIPPTKDTELLSILHCLPQSYQDQIHTLQRISTNQIVEIILDHGRVPYLRYEDRKKCKLQGIVDMKEVLHHLKEVHACKDDELSSKWGTDLHFTSDNRLGIDGTLHRISAMRDKNGEIAALTFRVGRYVRGCADLVADLIAKVAGVGDERPKSLLLLGPPGVGKTTLLRDITRQLSEKHEKDVIVVDTSNEIAGDGLIPHECIGSARRMQIVSRSVQYQIMREAVQNHNPQVIVVDEIGSMHEAIAARDICLEIVQISFTPRQKALHL